MIQNMSWGTKFCENCSVWFNSKTSEKCPLCEPVFEHKYLVKKDVHNHVSDYIQTMKGLGQKRPPGRGWTIKTDKHK